MANADFNQKQNSAVGGFDSASYRETAKPEEEAVRLTPAQQKLADLEAKLPKALANRATALALCAVIMLGGFVGFGTGKLRAKYNEAKSWYTVGLEADGGYTLRDELTTCENTAANILTTARNTLGADNDEVKAAEEALEDFSQALEEYGVSEMNAIYLANGRLDKAIDQLYAKLQEQAEDPMKMGAVQGQYGQFNSAQTIIGNLAYNEAVAEYNSATGGFPANVLKGLAGIKEVEQFA